jgi:hypothetical protein
MIRSNDIIELIQLDSIQLSVRMNMTIDDFFASNGPTEFVDRLAACLGIPSYRIRVVDVKSGSTICETIVNSNPSLVGKSATNSSYSSAQQEELVALNTLLQTMASNGSLVLNAPIISLSSNVVSASISNSTANVSDTPVTITPPTAQIPVTSQNIPSGDSSTFFNWWIYMLIGIGCVLVIAVVVIYGIVLQYCYKRMHQQQVSPRVGNEVVFERVESPKSKDIGSVDIQDLDVLGTADAGHLSHTRHLSQIPLAHQQPTTAPPKTLRW